MDYQNGFPNYALSLHHWSNGFSTNRRISIEVAIELKEMNNQNPSSVVTSKMPVLFLGHGSPMNAIEENEFGEGWRTVAIETKNLIR
jgi:hypothetical protein